MMMMVKMTNENYYCYCHDVCTVGRCRLCVVHGVHGDRGDGVHVRAGHVFSGYCVPSWYLGRCR